MFYNGCLRLSFREAYTFIIIATRYFLLKCDHKLLRKDEGIN